MYLKTVDLFGFKTFAERTCFAFEPGISGIVGPNGSGKSNLVDAVRWVLGEQSAKQLRGDRMDAVIFAGNNRRRPLGIAEVTLTFDNSDGVLASPFAEISVTRRVYRNGEGEYFLNRTHVRLKDIIDLLMGTGLGPDAAAIISQGQIDAILSAKPEARREVLEEVAGTSRYQARKREAQRRLEQTDQNALRVNDVLVELETQMPAIERQVRRAKRYRKLQQRLRDLEIVSFVRKTADRRKERGRIAAELVAPGGEPAGGGAKRARLEAELSKQRCDEYQATLALDDRNSARNEAAAAVQQAASDQARVQAHFEETQRRAQSLELEVDAAAREVANAESRVVALTAELAATRTERDENLRAAEEAAQSERLASVAWEGAYGALRALEDKRAHAAAKAAEGDSVSRSAQAERDRAAAAVARLDEQLAQARERGDAERRRTAGLESEIAAIEKEVMRCTAAVADAERACESAKTALVRARKALEVRRAAVVETSARLEATREITAGGIDLPPGVAAVRTAAAAGKLKGIVGVVGELIEADAEHAAAIDAALGSGAHHVVVRTSEDAKAAIELLKSERGGRATFLPLDAIAIAEKRPTADVKSAAAGVVGEALGLVRVKPQAKRALEYLLGDVVIVDTLATGIRLAANAPNQTFAALGGELVRGAAITGGASESGPLARRAIADALAAELGALASAQDAARQEFEDAERLEKVAADALGHARNAGVDAQLRAKDARAALELVRAQVDAIAAQISDLESLRVEARSALNAAAADAKDFGERATLSKRSIGEIEGDRAKAAAESDRLQAELHALRDRHRSLAAQTAALVERVAQVADDGERARADMLARRSAHEKRSAALAQTRSDIEAYRGELETLHARRDAADRQLAGIGDDAQTLRAQRDAIAAKVRDLEEQVAAAQSEEREQSHELERRKIRVAEIDAELSMLQETFAQNPASQADMDDVGARYADFQGDADEQVREMRVELDRLGDVNLNALEDQTALVDRRDFLRRQLADLEAARASILAVIAEIDAESVRQFNEMFDKVAEAFAATFARLFGGGVGKIWLAESDDPMAAGVEMAAQPPGKKMQSLHALSGGERALTAVALIFAILQVRPSPFYIFDEIDAALDEANIGRFGGMLADLAGRAQIIIITHNKATMTLTDRLYGVTMGEPGVSSVLSLALEQVGA